MRITAIATAVLMLVGATFGQTNYTITTNNPGTRLTVPVTTSALWRRILPTETAMDVLFALGMTNDANGVLYWTNSVNSTNLDGRFVARITSPHGTIDIGVTTNSNGSMFVTLDTDLSMLLSQLATNIAPILHSNTFYLSNVQLLEVFNMGTNLVTQGLTNHYWMDLAHTNSFGLVDIYATLTPTNDIQIELPTNGFRGAILSFNVLARGTNRTIYFPTNFTAFNTNDAGLALHGSKYVGILTNGNEYRFTIQSNDTWSVMTKSFGQ